MTDAKGQGKSVEELFPCPFFTGAETGQCKSNGSLYAARHLWEEAAKRLKGQIKGQTEKRSPKPYGFRLLSGRVRQSGYFPDYSRPSSLLILDSHEQNSKRVVIAMVPGHG